MTIDASYVKRRRGRPATQDELRPCDPEHWAARVRDWGVVHSDVLDQVKFWRRRWVAARINGRAELAALYFRAWTARLVQATEVGAEKRHARRMWREAIANADIAARLGFGA